MNEVTVNLPAMGQAAKFAARQLATLNTTQKNAALLAIADEIETDPKTVRSSPHTTPVRRLDEVAASRKPNVRWRGGSGLQATDSSARLSPPGL